MGTVIRLTVEKLPSGGANKPLWLWWSDTPATEADVDRCWPSFLRRFDLEHTFRFFKQTLGWTESRLGSSEPAHEDRLPGRCIKSVPSRPWVTARFEQQPPSHQARGGTRSRNR